MDKQQLDALDVRELLTTPSGECDHELKAALEKKLTDKGIGGAALQLFHEALALR